MDRAPDRDQNLSAQSVNRKISSVKSLYRYLRKRNCRG
ncbi:MAG: site-specific integrase [Alistipes indistinctus]